MTDAEFHTATLNYAQKFNKSYSEAANAVRELHPVVLEPGASLSDIELHAQAKTYAHKNNLSYAEALGAVCGQALTRFDQIASFSEPWQGQVDHQATRTLEGQLVEIFKAGRHTSEDGQALDFSTSDIRAMAMAYTPAVREAPLVVGHPQNNFPAYGWVKGLTATDDGRLLMQAGQVMPAFAQMVQDGRFKKRSASFYPPQHPGNPRPGNWYLRHVGWLGAQQPAVAGLKDVSL